MAKIAILVALLVPMEGAGRAPVTPPRYDAEHKGCNTRACDRRVTLRLHRKVIRRWRATAAPYAGWLANTRRCESGGSGSYRLATTGNGFWFAYQHTAQSWYAAGGRSFRRRPVGMWTIQPTAAEQDYRAVITLRQQGRGAWPVCG